MESSSEHIMFTENEQILDNIEAIDWLNKIPQPDLLNKNMDFNSTIERPKTATKRFDENDIKEIGEYLKKQENVIPKGIDGRPLTMAKLAQ